MPELAFQEAGHKYSIGGLRIWSTTQIIEASAPLSDFAKDAKAAAFGTEFHKVSAYLDRGEFEGYEYDHVMDPWLDGWRKFRRDFPYLVPFQLGERPCIEMRLYSSRFDFAGALDRVWWNPVDRYVIINDIKTGGKCPTWQLQTAAYQQLFVETVPNAPPARRWITQVKEGGYKLHKPENPWKVDLNVFLSMQSVWNWKAENNQIPKEHADG